MALTEETKHKLFLSSLSSKNPEDLLNAVLYQIEMKDARIKKLEEEVKHLKEENWKDEELQKMKERYEEMKRAYYRGFPIDDDAQKKIDKFIAEHKQPHGVSGGGFKYTFVPTALGTSGTITAMNGDKLQFEEIG